MLEPGAPAPDFTLLDTGGGEVSLGDFRSRTRFAYLHPGATTGT